jgi:mannose/fructose/N-acetylgalactosamine-specific phosphotransferase system component IIB
MSRIDDRLIHGQVVEGWVNFLKATGIFVADDRVASNAFQRSIMELSVPQGLKVAIGRVEDTCRRAAGHQVRIGLPGDQYRRHALCTGKTQAHGCARG